MLVVAFYKLFLNFFSGAYCRFPFRFSDLELVSLFSHCATFNLPL